MRAHVLGQLGLTAVQGQSGSDVLRPCWGHGPLVSPKLCRELSCVLHVGSVSGRRRPGFQVHRGKQISKAPPQGGPSARTWLLAKAPCLSFKLTLSSPPPLAGHSRPQTPFQGHPKGLDPGTNWGGLGGLCRISAAPSQPRGEVAPAAHSPGGPGEFPDKTHVTQQV